MNQQYAQQWAEALTTDTDAYVSLYAADGDFCVERSMVDDHVDDTLTDRQMLRERVAGLANGDPSNGLGVHTLTVTEWTGDSRYGLIEWSYSVEGISAYRGIANADAKTLETNGSTFLQFDEDGKITLESTVTNDVPVFAQLGIPVATPHYWDADFDPAALA